jgi:hypothetical protein
MKRQAGFETDESVAYELFNWIMNSQVPYRQYESVVRNMTRKLAQDRYDPELAIKAFMYAAESGAKDYAQEFGGSWHEMFPKEIRRLAAQMLRDEFEDEVELNPEHYEQHVFKKDVNKWRERYPQREAATDAVDNAWEWVRTDREAILQDIDRLGLDGAVDYNMELIEEQIEKGDNRWLYIEPEDLYHAFEALESENFNRGASAAQNQRGDIMTRRQMSRRRRQRLANRVERARSRTEQRDREQRRDRRTARTDSRVSRLNRRVASLTRLLKAAERELKLEERVVERRARTQGRSQEDPRERVARIIERLDQDRKRRNRLAAVRARRSSKTEDCGCRERRSEKRRTAPRQAAEGENPWVGWKDKKSRASKEKFWKSIGGSVDKCMAKMKGNVDDPGAFCASLKDEIEGKETWRGKGKEAATAEPPRRLRRKSDGKIYVRMEKVED